MGGIWLGFGLGAWSEKGGLGNTSNKIKTHCGRRLLEVKAGCRTEGLAKHLPLAKIMNTRSRPRPRARVRAAGLQLRGIRRKCHSTENPNENVSKSCANWASNCDRLLLLCCCSGSCCFCFCSVLAAAQFSPLALVTPSPDNCSWPALPQLRARPCPSSRPRPARLNRELQTWRRWGWKCMTHNCFPDTHQTRPDH